MKASYKIGLATLVGFGLGAMAVQGLHAQAKPPAYTVSEIEITNLDGYQKEYAPLAAAARSAAGGRQLAAGQNAIALEGMPPKTRITINQFDSLEKAQAWRGSAQYNEARKVGDKYAKFRSYAIEGLPQ